MHSEIKFFRVDNLASTTTIDSVKTLFGVKDFPVISQDEYTAVLTLCRDKEWTDWANTWQEWRKNGFIKIQQ